jgi:hypothetical protein
VSELLHVPCFRYCGEELSAVLSIEHGCRSDLLVTCPVRRRGYFLTPEERVRQALIWFFLEGAKNVAGWRERLRFEVEQRSLDIAAFLVQDTVDDRFFLNSPVMIVETKRYERDLKGDAAAEFQLRTYMTRDRCRSGLLFNAGQAAWLSLDGDVTEARWTKEHLTDLYEVECRLQTATAAAASKVLSCRNIFTRATAGDFEALLRLLSLIGNDSRLTFTLSIRTRGNLISVQAFGIRTLGHNITYRARGVVSRNRQQLTREDFHSLLAVRPL